MLVGDNGSGTRRIAASSISGGWPVDRVRTVRALRAFLNMASSFFCRNSLSSRFCSKASRVAFWMLIFWRRDCKAMLVESTASPCLQASRASGSFLRAKSARDER